MTRFIVPPVLFVILALPSGHRAAISNDDPPDTCRRGLASAPPGSETRPNEPSAFVPVACLNLHDPELDGALLARITSDRVPGVGAGWEVTREPTLEIVPVHERGGSRSFAARARYPAGWTGGYSPVWIEKDISGADVGRLYLSFELKVSENWQGHHVGDKVFYVWSHERPVLYPLFVGGGQAPLTTQVRIQDVPDGARNLQPNLSDPVVDRGEWHHWELLLVQNTPGLADGGIHWWIDGEKAGEYGNVKVSGATHEPIWERLAWRPIWGGRGGEIRQDQYMWIRELYSSGAP